MFGYGMAGLARLPNVLGGDRPSKDVATRAGTRLGFLKIQRATAHTEAADYDVIDVSILHKIAAAWRQLTDAGEPVELAIITNRAPGPAPSAPR